MFLFALLMLSALHLLTTQQQDREGNKMLIEGLYGETKGGILLFLIIKWLHLVPENKYASDTQPKTLLCKQPSDRGNIWDKADPSSLNPLLLPSPQNCCAAHWYLVTGWGLKNIKDSLPKLHSPKKPLNWALYQLLMPTVMTVITPCAPSKIHIF